MRSCCLIYLKKVPLANLYRFFRSQRCNIQVTDSKISINIVHELYINRINEFKETLVQSNCFFSPEVEIKMKNQYTIFYSWMSDRPNGVNRKYIRKILEKDAKKLEKELGITIRIDSDSRDEDGSKSIEENVLKKISNSDLFVGDITPVAPRFLMFGKNKKLVANSNVMYELGFAVSTLGWNRCIMVWNSKYGNLNQAPFDIRNHATITYKSGKQELSLYNVLKTKIENHEQYVRSWRTTKERSFDAEKYNDIIRIFPERNLVDSIEHFLTNRVYNCLDSDRWDYLIYYYNHYPDNRFVDEEIHQAYLAFLTKLQKMCQIAFQYNERLSFSGTADFDNSDEWKRKLIYKIKDPYEKLPPDEATELEMEIEDEFRTIIPSLMDSYKSFRDQIRSKLLI